MDRCAKTVTLDPINQLASTLHFALNWILCFSFFTGNLLRKYFFVRKAHMSIIILTIRRYGAVEGGRFCFEGGTRCGKWVKSSSRESESFFNNIFKRTFSGACILCLLLLCFDFDSLRDPRHLASVQLVVNSSSFTLDLHFHANTTALSAKISFHLHKTFTFLELSLL